MSGSPKPPSRLMAVNASAGLVNTICKVSTNAVKNPFCCRSSHGRPERVATVAPGLTAPPANCGGGLAAPGPVSCANSEICASGCQVAMPSRQPRTIRRKLSPMLVHLLRRRQFSFAEDFREAFAHSVIVDRPDIGSSQIEKQKHFRGPAPDPAHLNQTFDNLIVGHFGHGMDRWHGALDCFGGEIF